jgi:hypothetical protein
LRSVLVIYKGYNVCHFSIKKKVSMDNKFLTINEVCKLLNISRPTLNAYREKFNISHTVIKGRTLFKKLEILEKLYYKNEIVKPEQVFTTNSNFNVKIIEIAQNVFDLRLIKTVDPFGALCLLCCLMGRVRRQEHIYLLIEKTSASFYLQSINFFQELMRTHSEYVHYKASIFEDVYIDQSETIVPLHLIGYRGGEKRILDDIYANLKKQGFSDNLCSSLGWVLGEIADNTLIHGGGVPCYFMISSTIGPSPSKFLTLTTGDVGKGIPVTVKSNPKYHELNDYQALITAFKSNVSSWDDIHKRGKGLNDILGVTKGNESWVIAESNGRGVFFDFTKAPCEINVRNAGTDESGTRYCLIFIDSEFNYISKKEINQLLDNHLELL